MSLDFGIGNVRTILSPDWGEPCYCHDFFNKLSLQNHLNHDFTRQCIGLKEHKYDVILKRQK